jgi:hypothetical protein
MFCVAMAWLVLDLTLENFFESLAEGQDFGQGPSSISLCLEDLEPCILIALKPCEY